MGLFDKLLSDAGVEATDKAVFERYPKIREEVDKADDYVSQWESWKAEHWDDQSRMTKDSVQLIRQKDAEIEALRLMQGGDMTWDDMKDNVVREIQGQVKPQLEGTLKPLLDQIESLKAQLGADPKNNQPLQQQIRNLERGMEFTYVKTAHLPYQYAKEFGADAPVFKLDEMFKYMQENKIADFDNGYQGFTAKQREAKMKADQDAREVQIKKEARDEAMKEFTLKGGVQPTDTQGPSPAATPLQRRLAAKRGQELEGVPKLTPGTIGDGTAAGDAYQAYLRDQAAGTHPTPIQ